MKLKRKLLPIIGASTGIGATAVALTGCSFFIGGGGGDWVNLLERYVPKNITQHKYEKISQSQAGEMYANNLGEQESTFAQDFYWSSYNMIEEAQSGRVLYVDDVQSLGKAGGGSTHFNPSVPVRSMKAVKHSAKISDFKLNGTKTWPVKGKEQTVMIISYLIDYSYVYNTSSSSEGIEMERVESGRTSISNVPFIMRYEDPYWAVRPAEELMTDIAWLASCQWAIHVQAKTVMTTIGHDTPYGDIEIVNTTNADTEYLSSELSEFTEDDVDNLRIEMEQTAYFQSWYMYWVACSDK